MYHEEHGYGNNIVPNSLQEVSAEDHNNMTTNFSQSFDVDENGESLFSPNNIIEQLQYHQIHDPPHVSFNNTTHVQCPLGFPEASIVCDPSTSSLGHTLGLPPQPAAPLFVEFGQLGDIASSSRNGVHGGKYCFFGSDGDELEGLIGGRVLNGDQEYGAVQQFGNNGVLLDFTMENLGCFGRGNKSIDRANPFASERQRRVQMGDKYNTLRDLIPNPTKPDRASTVADAIEYIKELTRTIHELKILVEKKRYARNQEYRRAKCRKTDQEPDAPTATMIDGRSDEKPILADHRSPHDQPYDNNMFLRTSSWLQRKSKDTEVDVRIIDDEVTVKIVQRKKINLLLVASEVLDQLRLDIRHIAGGCIGNSYSFLFNTKIGEGSSLYAGAIANKFIEVLDLQYAVTSLQAL